MEVIANSPQGEAVVQAEIPVYKPRTMQTVIAAILSGFMIFQFYISFVKPLLAGGTYHCDDQQEFYFYVVFCPLLLEFAIAIGLLLLGLQANNKSTRVALVVGCISSLLAYVLPLYAECAYAESSYIVLPFAENIRHLPLPSVFYHIMSLWVIYAYAIVIASNNISNQNKNWIGILMLLNSKAIAYTLLWDLTPGEIIYNDDFVRDTPTFKGIELIFILLSAVAFWKFARCEAFSNNYDASAKPNYSPLNKYMAMAIIVPAIILLSLYLLYSCSGLLN